MAAYDRVGYMWASERILHFDLGELEEKLRESNMVLVHVNITKPLEEQGPFNVIMHKMATAMARARYGSESDQTILQNMKRYLAQNPSVTLLDPLENVELLLDRLNQYNIIRACLEKEEGVFVPDYVPLVSTDVAENERRIRNSGLQYPLICKPFASCGTSEAHEMTLIFDPTFLGDADVPCLAQTFINHNAILYKVYSIGDVFRVVERPSVKNLQREKKESLRFHSSISRACRRTNQMWLTETDEGVAEGPTYRPAEERLTVIHQTLRRAFGLDIFGIDIIMDTRSGRHAIIDVNSFPGFAGVPDFVPRLVDFLVHTSDKTYRRNSTFGGNKNTLNLLSQESISSTSLR